MQTQAQSKKWAASDKVETPYRKALQEWDRRMGSSLKQARTWRTAAFVCMGLTFFAIAGVIYLGTLPKKVVDYVTIDGAGTATYIGEAGSNWKTFTPTEAQVGRNLRRLIDDTRSLSSDPMIIRKNWLDAYTLLAGEATQILSQYAQANDPFQRSKEVRINVNIETAYPVTDDTWQVDWTEESWSKQGARIGKPESWRGSFTVERLEPEGKNAQQKLRDNPISVYVTRFSWQKSAR